MRISVCFAALLGLALLVPSAPAQDKKAPPPATPGKPGSAADRDAAFKDLIGKPAPEFLGEFALNGKPTPLKDLQGKVVVVDFWAVWCGPCVQTFPHLRELHSKYKAKGLELVGLTSYYSQFSFDKGTGKLTRAGQKLSQKDEQAMLKDFAEYHKLEHRLVVLSAEENKQVSKDYKVTGIPHVVVIDRKGIVRLVKVGSGEANAKAIEETVKKLLDDKA
jgi:thiol-disulfide isomerase/thioredoxin